MTLRYFRFARVNYVRASDYVTKFLSISRFNLYCYQLDFCCWSSTTYPYIVSRFSIVAMALLARQISQTPLPSPWGDIEAFLLLGVRLHARMTSFISHTGARIHYTFVQLTCVYHTNKVSSRSFWSSLAESLEWKRVQWRVEQGRRSGNRETFALNTTGIVCLLHSRTENKATL